MISNERIPATPLPYVVLSQVEATQVKWLWEPYIPCGALSMIVGDGGYGKSFMCCALAADLSAGRALPGNMAQPPKRILMISAEDGIGPVIKPRLAAMDANMENIAVYDEGFKVSAEAAERIYLAAEQFDAAVVFLDPMVVYLGGEVDFFKANEVRSVLERLTHIAKAKEIAVVGVHHVKKHGGDGQHKSLGSVDFVNGVRSTLLVDTSKTGPYFMSHVKHNWSKAGHSLAYAVRGDKFEWLGRYDAGVDTPFEITRTRRGQVKAFLIEALRDGPVPMRELLQRGMDEGMTESAIMRIKPSVCTSKHDGKTGIWYWHLNESLVEAHPSHKDEAEALMRALGAQAPGLHVEGESEEDRLLREAKERLDASR